MKGLYLRLDNRSKKIRLTVYGTRWEVDENGKCLGLGGLQVKLHVSDIDLSEHDIWNVLIDVENI